jgi:hypothetical protein
MVRALDEERQAAAPKSPIRKCCPVVSTNKFAPVTNKDIFSRTVEAYMSIIKNLRGRVGINFFF